jgi:hypothetical protein
MKLVMLIWKPPFDYGVNRAGFVIHAAIHRARHDVDCIIHTHTPAGMAVSAMACGLLPMTQTAMRFARVGYHDYEGVAVDVAEGREQRPVSDEEDSIGPFQAVNLAQRVGEDDRLAILKREDPGILANINASVRCRDNGGGGRDLGSLCYQFDGPAGSRLWERGFLGPAGSSCGGDQGDQKREADCARHWRFPPCGAFLESSGFWTGGRWSGQAGESRSK